MEEEIKGVLGGLCPPNTPFYFLAMVRVIRIYNIKSKPMNLSENY